MGADDIINKVVEKLYYIHLDIFISNDFANNLIITVVIFCLFLMFIYKIVTPTSTNDELIHAFSIIEQNIETLTKQVTSRYKKNKHNRDDIGENNNCVDKVLLDAVDNITIASNQVTEAMYNFFSTMYMEDGDLNSSTENIAQKLYTQENQDVEEMQYKNSDLIYHEGNIREDNAEFIEHSSKLLKGVDNQPFWVNQDEIIQDKQSYYQIEDNQNPFIQPLQNAFIEKSSMQNKHGQLSTLKTCNEYSHLMYVENQTNTDLLANSNEIKYPQNSGNNQDSIDKDELNIVGDPFLVQHTSNSNFYSDMI
ncbi:uncharacterized protein CMU_008830 [Cryptosporidium muris RN66]|uniref:Uncharacterized protein n=1 Tax=Cryptosporidium muris (strain RN66) TaxID=441375 RepID=B6ADV1_CRYMR|nr:uncharacterized protein CMU_008830 [Cryptosporidium muris RN66]EEA06392.1 hypothetical protein CMU_008830 [Cryptosporidium muris RN66]|eukprot:XP_002140741.1 hypothetical protein [Cryptosporidium muris RN66]